MYMMNKAERGKIYTYPSDQLPQHLKPLPPYPRPKMPHTKRIINPPLLLPLTLRANKLIKITLQMGPQHLNIGMHLSIPVLVYICYIRHEDLLAAEAVFDFCAVVEGGGVGGCGAWGCVE
jgi:hypothetical protein